MRLAMSDELATDDDPNAEGYEVDTFARGPDGPDSDDEDDVEAKKTSQGHNSRGVRDDNVVFEIGDEDEEGDLSKDGPSAAKREGGGERRGLMSGSVNNSEETLVPAKRRADKND